MNLLGLHPDRNPPNTIYTVLHLACMAFLVLLSSSFLPSGTISGLLAPQGDERLETYIQASQEENASKEQPDISLLEVEEVEESKEEKKEGTDTNFVFCSPANIAASEHVFLVTGFLRGVKIIPFSNTPRYLLFHNLRIPNS